MSKNHYVYLLTSKEGDKYSIGVRSCSCSIWDDKYMGSSKHMTKKEKTSCSKIVLKIFTNREDAVAYEIEMHDKFDVAVNPQFWNRAKQTATGFDRAGVKVSEELLDKYYRGKKFSEEHRKNLSAASKGRVFTDKHEEGIGAKHKGKIVKEESKLYGADNPMYGKTHSKEAAEKMQVTRTKFPSTYCWVHKTTGKVLYHTWLEMGQLFDPHKQSSCFTKLLKNKSRTAYGWKLKE